MRTNRQDFIVFAAKISGNLNSAHENRPLASFASRFYRIIVPIIQNDIKSFSGSFIKLFELQTGNIQISRRPFHRTAYGVVMGAAMDAGSDWALAISIIADKTSIVSLLSLSVVDH
jgi:hypothetical protein